MKIGDPIKTIGHAYDWCFVKRNPVYLRPKNKGDMEYHKWKMVTNMNMGGLVKIMERGRLFELHAPRDKGGRIIINGT